MLIKLKESLSTFFCHFFKFFLNLSFCSFIFFGIEVRFFWAEKSNSGGKEWGGGEGEREGSQQIKNHHHSKIKSHVKKVSLGKRNASIPRRGRRIWGWKGGCDEAFQGGQTQGLVSFPGEICCQGKGGLPLPLENRVPGHGWCLSVGCLMWIPRALCFQRQMLPHPLWPGLPRLA